MSPATEAREGRGRLSFPLAGQVTFAKMGLEAVSSVEARPSSGSMDGASMEATAYLTHEDGVNLVWQINSTRLAEKERLDGRYLLVTNDWNLSHHEMFQLYREKDAGEKRFFISKNDLKVALVYLHKDRRIASMMMLNMVALLAYSLLERQMRQQGLQITTRQLNQTVTEFDHDRDPLPRWQRYAAVDRPDTRNASHPAPGGCWFEDPCRRCGAIAKPTHLARFSVSFGFSCSRLTDPISQGGMRQSNQMGVELTICSAYRLQSTSRIRQLPRFRIQNRFFSSSFFVFKVRKTGLG